MKRTFGFTALLIAAIAIPARAEDTPGQAAAKRNTEFAFELYAKLREKEGNLFCSPFSISTALAMTSVGAREQTLKEMASTLHLADGVEGHQGFEAIIKQLNSGDPAKRPYQLSTANALWGQKGMAWKQDFLDSTSKHYGAGLREVDYIKATEASRKTINDWVEKETQDKIKELLKSGVLTVDTRLVLTNAIYFKGTWMTQFDKKRTVDRPFHVTAKESVKVPMMSQTGTFNYFGNQDFQALEMPYSGKDLSMVIFLPRKVDGLANFEKTMNATNVRQWIAKLSPTRKIEMMLPRFKFEAEFSLAEQLKSLGMKSAFVLGGADFSGMNGGRDLFISAVVHKAFVEVNEEGTEAAAATGVVVTTTSVQIDQAPRFIADHPFVFLIRDNRSGSVLFVGRVANPK